jgi:hypothetical protein
VPIEPGPSFAETRAWVEELRTIAGVAGDRERAVGEEERVERRLDYTQNAEQDARRAVLGGASGGAGFGADRVGRARRHRAALRPVDDRDVARLERSAI